MDKLRKIPTNIKGLDDLLYNGLHFNDKEGMVIAICGEDSVHKLQFAMHLMCGVTKSLKVNKSKDKDKDKDKDYPWFFSFTKDETALNDICIDFQISNGIFSYIEKFRKGELHDNDVMGISGYFGNKSGNKSETQSENTINKINQIYGIIAVHYLHQKQRNVSDQEKVQKILHYGLIDDFLYYNTRTKHLHCRINDICDGDTNENALFNRKSDTLGNYFKEQSDNLNDWLIKVKFNSNLSNETSESASKSASETKKAFENRSTRSKYIWLQSTIESIVERIENGEEKKCPCIVIHGFSKFNNDELSRLPISYLIQKSKQMANIVILVFDERGKDLPIDVDMFIHMRKNEQPYLYYELMIRETAYQTAALGWHHYKLRDYGIEVFPSIHRIIQKRYYMSSVDSAVYNSFNIIPYERYFYNEYAKDNSKGGQMKPYKNWLENKDKYYSEKSNDGANRIQITFNNIILDLYDDKTLYRRKITALIGAPNTFKRHFSNIRLYNKCCNKKEHTLVILFDKDQTDYYTKLLCPCQNKNCNECFQRIHFFCVRMGCILPAELFYKIQQILEWRFKDGKGITNIIINDLQKIDYSFPLLKEEPLFLPALITFCKDKNIGLQLICNKSASMSKALCSHADEVITFNRETCDQNSAVDIIVEKSPVFTRDSTIYKFRINDVNAICKCNEKKLEITTDEVKIVSAEVNSMSDFWRDSLNVHTCK